MLNPIFWKKVQWQKLPGRWAIAEHQIPSIKVLFEINTKSHQHPSVRPFIREQDTIGKPKKRKSGIQPTTVHSPEIQSYSIWWGAASPILNDTPVVCIYIRPITELLKNAYICLLLLISMLWHRQAIFESKGDKLSSSAECRIRTHQGLRHQIASRLNARWQTDWAIEDQAKNLNSTARPYDQRAFSPLDPTAVFGIHTWLWRYTCLLLLISMLWHRQAIFESKGDKLSYSAECRIRTHHGLRHQIASRLNARWQTDCAIEDQAKNLNSTARPYDQRAFSPLDPTAVFGIRTWLWR